MAALAIAEALIAFVLGLASVVVVDHFERRLGEQFQGRRFYTRPLSALIEAEHWSHNSPDHEAQN